MVGCLSFGLAMVIQPVRASAATTNTAASAKISFTFDDGLQSTITQAAPTLKKYGYTGTSYVATGCVGMTTKPNTCHADTDEVYMTWSQVKQLQNSYGWEIGSHTVSHPYLATSDAADGQPNTLTADQVDAELKNSKAALAAQGINAVSFATPYGDYNPSVLAQIAKYYENHRGFADTGYNSWPYSDYYLRVQQVQAGVSVATVKGYIDAAKANNQWLILVFHDVQVNPSTRPVDYEYKTADLASIAAYAKSKGLVNTNVKNATVRGDANLLPNGSFNSGIGSGWSTDNPTAITADTSNNGSFPDAAQSVKFVAGGTNAHLFAPQVAVNSGTTYLFKNYLNVTKRTSGSIGFYVDEYDAGGNWISGQYKGGEGAVFAESFNATYKPSSSNVAHARYQVILSGGSGITAYLDNVQMLSLNSVVVPPPVNLISNGNFDAGMSAGWSTDSPVSITVDAASKGSPSNPVQSIKLTSADGNKHLFGPRVGVVFGKSYTISNYLDVKAITGGEVGFYIDEYDVNGNWISGQYKTGVRAISTGRVNMNYAPSSASVSSASLQVIVTGNSGIEAYYDDATWFAN